ncbi:AIP3-domain-containing protein [Backusella circina FSU 941]|nr:AIP3-domain-containing protein [Backusella circina FSU 941]
MSNIEQSVSRLLMSTKKLLETLTAWSSGKASDKQVHDEYCVLEVYFANTTRAFESAQLSMGDMIHLPDDLYSSLNATLSNEPSSATLEEHLPVIRDIILKLLHGLKQKQSVLRERLENTQNNQQKLQHQQHSKNLLPLHTHQLSTTSQSAVSPLPTPTSSTEPFNYNSNRSLLDQSVHPHDSEEFDINDPSTKDALDALNLQENLARRSSVRRASLLAHYPLGINEIPPPPAMIPNKTVPFYIQKGEKLKKVTFQRDQLSLIKLKELFQSRFPGPVSADIYILDPKSDINYELENIEDVKPYSILSVKDHSLCYQLKIRSPIESNTPITNQVRSLLEDAIQKIALKLEETSVTTDAASPAYIPLEAFKKQKKELENLRFDMTTLTNVYKDFKEETNRLIDTVREKSRHIHINKSDSIAPLQNKCTEINNNRARMMETKDSTRDAATTITTRLEELQDTIDHIKLDVTQRRCRPSKAQLKHCEEESKILRQEMDDLSDKIKTFKPTWKKTWETELQDIVDEQQFLKDQEALLVDLKEDHNALLDVLDQLAKISEIQERKHQQPGVEFRRAPMEEGFEGMTSVIKQVSNIQVDHNRRVKALVQAEKMRALELSQRIDAFEEELTDFVGCNKLKKTGGAQAIDRQRQEKDQALIKQIFALDEKNDEKQEEKASQKDEEDIDNPTQSTVGVE